MMECIDEILRLKKERQEADKKLALFQVPILSDRSYIPKVLEILKENIDSRNSRYVFLFVILLLYDPGFFVDGRVMYGLRKDIAKCLGVKSESAISNQCSGIIFMYGHYEDFRKDVERAYEAVTSHILT